VNFDHGALFSFSSCTGKKAGVLILEAAISSFAKLELPFLLKEHGLCNAPSIWSKLTRIHLNNQST
jgi:hypothetical protein